MHCLTAVSGFGRDAGWSLETAAAILISLHLNSHPPQQVHSPVALRIFAVKLNILGRVSNHPSAPVRPIRNLRTNGNVRSDGSGELQTVVESFNHIHQPPAHLSWL